ncbi:MAG: His/Gly/Thr/Pro-type tRNA ligase C-terminal domain-containing protein, partial [Candidatus Heimdallarchaeota archaeon]
FIAPTQAVIVPIYKKEQKELVLAEANKVKEILVKAGIRIELDEREGYTPGWKFNEWEVRGVPIRIEIGPRDIENKQVVLVRRDTGDKISVLVKDAAKTAKKILKEIQKFMQKRADKLLADNISHPKDYAELKEIQKTKRGFCRANWCGDQTCCGSKAKEVVYIAPAY